MSYLVVPKVRDPTCRAVTLGLCKGWRVFGVGPFLVLFILLSMIADAAKPMEIWCTVIIGKQDHAQQLLQVCNFPPAHMLHYLT